MKHEGYGQRFPQAFMIYEGGAMPALEGEIVVGMAMTNRIQPSRLLRDTSSFRTVDETALVTTDDKTFRPVDIELGPDGAIYVADWSDVRLSHLNPTDTWDKTNGRIFRIAPKNFARPRQAFAQALPPAAGRRGFFLAFEETKHAARGQ
jgi:glucose/arabinose dehydrogenase